MGGLGTVIEIAAGDRHTCALLGTGDIRCWGRNDHGQLGNKTITPYSAVPVTVYRQAADPMQEPIVLTGATHITAGANHTCAITTDGAFCWGDNEFGQLGDGGIETAAYGMPVAGFESNVTALAAGGQHTCGVANGVLHCWGSDESRQLGDGTGPIVWTPTESTALRGRDGLVAGVEHYCATHSSWPTFECGGRNREGQLRDGAPDDSAYPNVIYTNPLLPYHYAAGLAHSCYSVDTGSLDCWGANDRGQLGDGSLWNVTSVGAGKAHTCARVAAGNVYCWGANDQGQVGDGTFNDALTPRIVRIPGFPMQPAMTNVSRVAAAYDHACALIAQGGGLRCWGSNDHGELGNGSTMDSAVAVPVTDLGAGAGVTGVQIGGHHTCALVQGGVQCWGFNRYGQLGNGDPAGLDSLTPGAVVTSDSDPSPLTGVTALATGDQHSCAVVNGGVRCWGRNLEGQLGYREPYFIPAYSVTPLTAIPDGSGIVAITAGAEHTCATKDTGEVLCWGKVLYGRLGNGDLGYAKTPQPVAVDLDTIFANDFEYPYFE